MTTMPPPSRPAAMAGPRAMPGPLGGPGPTGGSSLDPVRLLRQYKWYLVAALVAGVVLGLGAFEALKRVAPQYRSMVTYQALPQTRSILDPEAPTIEREEFDRFTQTQSRIMISDRVLREAIKDPSVRTGTAWAKKWLLEGGQVDPVEGIKDLRDGMVGARPVQGTNLVELWVAAGSKTDAAILVNAVHAAYWRDLAAQVSTASREPREALLKLDGDLKNEIQRLETQMRAMLERSAINANDAGGTAERNELNIIQPQIVDLKRTLDRLQEDLKRLEEQLANESGPTYTDDIREQAERSQIVASLTAEIANLRATRQAQLDSGRGPNHRDIKDIDHLINANQAEVDRARETEMKRVFDTQVEQTRQAIAGVRVQLETLETKRDALTTRIQDIVRVFAEYRQLEDQRAQQVAKQREVKAVLDDQDGQGALNSSDRVGRMRLLERGREPDGLLFPRRTVTIGLALFLCLGGTAGLVVLKEMLDQRIKGPSDVTLIPRMRLLGVVPLAADDPGKPAAPETAFLDAPTSAIAESFRQMRPALVKRMQQAGHRSLLVVGAMPESGSSTVAANLAMACAAADQRVLLIDANFRRPALHRLFKLGEGPGLGNVLARGLTMEEAIQQTRLPQLHLLSAGNAQARSVPERLATEIMTQVIREASARYDLVIVDTAPAMVAGDGLALANRCDAVALVVRALGEKRGLVARIRDQLSDSRAEFLGSVINAVKASAGGYLKRNMKTSYEYHNPNASA